MHRQSENHDCTTECIEEENRILSRDPTEFILLNDGILSTTESLFSVPLKMGWTRSEGMFTTPCGQKAYKLSTVKKFIKKTGSKLSVDQFNFDFSFNCWSRPPTSTNVIVQDVSSGQENLPVRVVSQDPTSAVDPLFKYSPKRIPIGDVDLNEDLVSGCDCKGDCSDRLSCGCRKLTDDASEGSIDMPDFGGYSNKRLKAPYLHGIYECNSKCSCSTRCQNRISQEGIKAQLEVFWTGKKGWGLRCIHDLPKGFFVCLYSGEVMTDSESERRASRGDEYFVKLSLIEIVEDKVGYEEAIDSDLLVLDDDEYSSEASVSSSSEDSTLDMITGKRRISSHPPKTKHLKTEVQKVKQEFVKVREQLVREKLETKSLNAPISASDEHYIIDAKRRGNIGRFLNHSCNPNCFLQNVFSATHDPRFPLLAFFTFRHVEALEELTWNYLYSDHEVFDCECGSDNCKARTLPSHTS
jgi:histone-lysine N-methyltransferase SETDB1